jgi:hypothetical protein
MVVRKRSLGRQRRATENHESWRSLSCFQSTGGVAENPGMVKPIEDLIGQPSIVPPEPPIRGCLGAALLAREDLEAADRLAQVEPLQHGQEKPAPQAGEEDDGQHLHQCGVAAHEPRQLQGGRAVEDQEEDDHQRHDEHQIVEYEV